ncbi:hypothetical protein GGR56DRAFT_303715 [Xylariaceae sp. FL0804]|nr:hypothetical protein GGR56DRAFT_303715 [Xylariaceae sp. FL0804]
MHQFTALTSLLALAPVGFAAPFAPVLVQTSDFNITALSATLPEDGPYGSGPIASSMSITLSYPSSSDAAISTTTCSTSWASGDSPGPTDWSDCADASLSWRLPTDGWTSQTNFRVEVFQTLSSDGSGLDATHYLDFNPGDTSDTSAYLSCIQMGEFQPLTCSLGGTPLAPHQPPVVMTATEETTRPS